MRSALAEALAALARALGTLGARWYLFGAQAALLYGAARLTADVDVTVQLGGRQAGALERALDQGDLMPRFEALLARSRRPYSRRARAPAS